MKIDYSQTIQTLAGKPYQADGKDLTLGDVVAEALATSDQAGKMKLYVLANDAYKGGVQDIDTADLSLVKKAVEGCKSYNGNAILLGQALTLLEDVK